MYPNNGRKSLKLDSTKDLKKGDTNFGISIYFANGISGNVLEMVNQLWASLKDEILKLDIPISIKVALGIVLWSLKAIVWWSLKQSIVLYSVFQ